MFVPRKILEEKLRQILAEDIGQGDVTAQAIIPPNLTVNAIVLAKEDGVAAGIEETTILAEYLGLKIKELEEAAIPIAFLLQKERKDI